MVSGLKQCKVWDRIARAISWCFAESKPYCCKRPISYSGLAAYPFATAASGRRRGSIFRYKILPNRNQIPAPQQTARTLNNDSPKRSLRAHFLARTIVTEPVAYFIPRLMDGTSKFQI